MEKIGRLGEGGAGLSQGHELSDTSSLLKLFTALRLELDQLYNKLNAEGTIDIDYGADPGVHEKQFES